VTQRPPRGGPDHRRGRIGARIVAAVLSLTVLLASGFGWHFYSDLTGGISTSDVISGGLGGAPAGSDTNILLVGVDSRTDAKGRPLSRKVLAELRSGAEDGVLNSDTIILVHVPASGQRATAISIPRDSYVDIPGFGRNKINSAYQSATLDAAGTLREQGVDAATVEQRSRTAGRAELVRTVEQLTGARIDHYAEVNLLGFFNLTTAIGGVDVCLKKPVDEFRSGARFPAGPQTISGADALAFVRQRHDLPQGDFSRIRRQQVFLAAVAHKILSAGTLANPARLAGLVESAKEAVVLDSGWDVLGFARQASNIAGGNMEFVTVPTTGGASNSHGDVVTVDPDQVKAFVAEKTGAAAPPPPDDGDAADAVPPSSVQVDVRNSTGTSGLASRVAGKLAAIGYRRGTVDNAEKGETTRSTSVHYPPGSSAAAQQVARLMGSATTEEDPRLPPGAVRVLVGSDFSMSDMRSSPGSSSSGRATSPPPPPAPPITPDGVPCVD
jgi:LCP family protein required for cell wall assembly